MLSDYLVNQFPATSDEDFIQTRLNLAWAILLLLCFVIIFNFSALIIKIALHLKKLLQRRRENQKNKAWAFRDKKVIAVMPIELEIVD
jgi:hypothetical protein